MLPVREQVESMLRGDSGLASVRSSRLYLIDLAGAQCYAWPCTLSRKQDSDMAQSVRLCSTTRHIERVLWHARILCARRLAAQAHIS